MFQLIIFEILDVLDETYAPNPMTDQWNTSGPISFPRLSLVGSNTKHNDRTYVCHPYFAGFVGITGR